MIWLDNIRWRIRVLAVVLFVGSCVWPTRPALAQPVVDGTLGANEYGQPLAVQTVPTGFGDLLSELDAAYGTLNSEGLSLAITGGLQSNSGPGGYNSFLLFIDSRPGGAVVTTDNQGFGTFRSSVAGRHTNDFSGFGGAARPLDQHGVPDPANLGFPDRAYAAPSLPSVFDPGFNPDFAITLASTDAIAVDEGVSGYEVHVIDLSVAANSQGADLTLGVVINADGVVNFDVGSVANAAQASALTTPRGTVRVATRGNSEPFGVTAFTDSNQDVASPGSGLEGDPLTAVDGFEFFLSSEFLANDGQTIRILPIISNGAGDYLSNQLLAQAGLPRGTGNLAFGPNTTTGYDADTNAATNVSGEAMDDGTGSYPILDPDGVHPLFDARDFAGNQFISIPFVGGKAGDFDQDGILGASDIDALMAQVRSGSFLALFDVNHDGAVDDADRGHWVASLRRTYEGDANLDGQFDSQDFVEVFIAGLYETDQAATWATGDWDGNGRFDSTDFVVAFVGGGYELGPRAAVSVPEPSSIALIPVAAVILGTRLRRAGLSQPFTRNLH